MTKIDPKMLEVLVCPITFSLLSYNQESQELVSTSAKLAYPIRNGIPVMLPSEARKLIKLFGHVIALAIHQTTLQHAA